MIKLTRINGTVLYLNPDLFQYIEETPDTVITFLDGKRFVVKEKAEEITDLIVNFKSRYYK